MSDCILPFTIDVEMKAYHGRAFPLGVIKANIPDYDIWLCNKLIIPVFSDSKNALDTLPEDLWSIKDGLSNVQSIQLEPKVFGSKMIDAIALNKEMLKAGRYITGSYNDFFIKGKAAYMKYDFSHDYVIFGYDDERNVFLSAGYLADKSYSFFDIDYDAYYKSMVENKATRSRIFYHQINKDYIPTIDIVGIKVRLCDYLYSRYSGSQEDSTCCYGLSAWDKFVEYVGTIGEKNLDYRYSRVYMEHRAIMLKRINKLYELGFLKNNSLADEYHQDVYCPTEIIHLLFMKYNLARNVNVLSRIMKLMKAANAAEAELLRKMIDKLKVF